MTPTPQQIIELAREAGFVLGFSSPALEKHMRFATLLLERFGQAPAVQQEPVAWMHWNSGPVRLFLNKDEAFMELERLNREYPVDAESRKMRPLVFGDTHPIPAEVRGPLTIDELAELMPDDHTPMSLGEAFVKFARLVEQAHGITGSKT